MFSDDKGDQRLRPHENLQNGFCCFIIEDPLPSIYVHEISTKMN